MSRRFNKYKRTAKRLYKAGKFAYKHRNTAIKAFQLAKKVARMVNVEYKYKLTNLNSSVSNTGGILPLCNIQQGANVDQRSGDSIKPMRLSGRVFVTQNGSAQKTLLRCIIFRGKQEQARTYEVTSNTPTDLQILDYDAAQTHLAPKSHDHQYASKILYDKTYHMSNNGNSSLILDWNFKLFGHITYQDADNDLIMDGGIYLLLISNESTNVPIFNTCLKLTYTDN